MSRIDIRGYATAAIVCIWLVATVLFAFFTNVYWQLAAMVAFGLLSLCAIATLAYAMGRWREDGIVGVVPLAVCVLAFVLAPFLSSSIRTYRFHLNKPAYERVVEGMESGRIPVSERSYFGSSALAAGDAYLVAGEYSSKGLTVEFLTDSGFPVKHSGYLYVEQAILPQDSFFDGRWPRRRRIDAHWYRISD